MFSIVNAQVAKYLDSEHRTFGLKNLMSHKKPFVPRVLCSEHFYKSSEHRTLGIKDLRNIGFLPQKKMINNYR